MDGLLGHFGGVLGCNTHEAFSVPRLTADAFCGLQQNPLSKQPKTHQTLFHALGHSITIVWAKTALIWSLLAPSTYLYVGIPKNETADEP